MKKIFLSAILILLTLAFATAVSFSEIECDDDQVKAYVCSNQKVVCFRGKNTEEKREKAEEDHDCKIMGIKCMDADDCE